MNNNVLSTKMKPCQSLPLFAAVLIGFIHAAEISCRAQFTFRTNSDGGLTITRYTGPGGIVIIPAMTNGLPVISIGNSAFNSPGLVSLTVPDSVRTIGDHAFNFCSSLTNLSLGAGVTNIGSNSFILCSSLLSIDVNSQNSAFSSLNGVLFDQSHKTLVAYPPGRSGPYTVPDTVTALGGLAFGYCQSLTDVLLPQGLLLVSADSFVYCSLLTHLTIPNTVTNIGDNALAGCMGLTAIALPDSVQYIGQQVFGSCKAITNVTIGKGLAAIGTWPFYFCSGLLSIDIDPLNAVYCSVDGVMFNRSRTILVAFPNARQGNYRVPEGVTTIASWSFGSCALSSITMPSSLVLVQAGACNSSFSLGPVYFLGNAPLVTYNSYQTFGLYSTLYYLPGTTGWPPSLDNHPTAPWVLSQPIILGRSVGATNGSFGFIVSWASNATVAVETCTNINSPAWTELESRALTNGFSYFGDSYWTNYPSRFYRLRSP